MRSQEWWDNFFLGMAQYIAGASKDPSTKVGAVIVDDERRLVSAGYNGFPRGVADTEERLNNRDLKYKMVVHAEMNALLFARGSVKDCTLYTVPFTCCSQCCGRVIQSGIKRCVSYFSSNPRWQEDFRLTEEMFKEAGIKLDLY